MGMIHSELATQHTDLIWAKLSKLRDAVAQRRSRVTCLRRWSEFIRERDGHRCVDCHSRQGLSAHHISRKSMFTEAEFETGNGITLCRECHKEIHHGFNGRPDLSLPVDAQGGEKLPSMERLYSILVDDAVDRGLMNDELYFLSDEVLDTFRKMQGYDDPTSFPGARIEQAYLILAEPERNLRLAIAAANGFTLPDQPLLPGGMVLMFEPDSEPTSNVVIQRYPARTVRGGPAKGSRPGG